MSSKLNFAINFYSRVGVFWGRGGRPALTDDFQTQLCASSVFPTRKTAPGTPEIMAKLNSNSISVFGVFVCVHMVCVGINSP